MVFMAIKLSGHGINHPPPPSNKVKERVQLYLYSPLWAFVYCSRVNLLTFLLQAINLVEQLLLQILTSNTDIDIFVNCNWVDTRWQ